MASRASRENGLCNREHVPLLILETTIQPKSNIIKRYLVFSSLPRCRFLGTRISPLPHKLSLGKECNAQLGRCCGEEVKNECVRG